MLLNVQGLTTVSASDTFSTSFTCGILNKIFVGSSGSLLSSYDDSAVDVVANGQTILNGASLGALLSLSKLTTRENDTKCVCIDFGGMRVNGNVEITIDNGSTAIPGMSVVAEVEVKRKIVNSYAVYKSNNITTTATSLLMYYGGTTGAAAVANSATTIVNNNVTTLDFTQASSLSLISGATNKTGLFYAGAPSRVNLNTAEAVGANDQYITRQTFVK